MFHFIMRIDVWVAGKIVIPRYHLLTHVIPDVTCALIASHSLLAVHCPHRICGAGSMQLSGVRPSVCLSVYTSVPPGCCTPLLWVCYCGSSGHEISIDCCTAGGQQQLYCSVTRSGKCEQCLVVS